MELLQEINDKGTTIIMVTHDQLLANQSQRNIHILDGRISTGDQAEALAPAAEVA